MAFSLFNITIKKIIVDEDGKVVSALNEIKATLEKLVDEKNEELKQKIFDKLEKAIVQVKTIV